MSVYTDGVHLVATDTEELHGFAQRIGLQRRWFQDHPDHPHYDLTSPRKVAQAVEAGAQMVEARRLLWHAKGMTRRAVSPKLAITRRPMTEEEKTIARVLAKCRFACGTFDKRFCKQLPYLDSITEKQAEWLKKLAYKYRGQIGDRWIQLKEALDERNKTSEPRPEGRGERDARRDAKKSA